MAHKLGSQFHIPHGLANALLISNVIRYNANDNPTKQTAFSQYDRPQARRRYAEIADHLGLSAPGDRTAAKSRNCWHGWKKSKLNWVFLSLSVKLAFRKLTSRHTWTNCLKMRLMTSVLVLTHVIR